jgi:hypothetical protein
MAHEARLLEEDDEVLVLEAYVELDVGVGAQGATLRLCLGDGGLDAIAQREALGFVERGRGVDGDGTALDELRAGTLTRIKQDDSLATYAAKIEKADCLIDFTKSANEVHNQIRGLSPIPLSFTYTPGDKMLKVCATEVAQREGTLAPCGTVLSLAGGKIEVACGCGSINILSVLPEGKKRMAASDFINGRKIAVGDVLSAQ